MKKKIKSSISLLVSFMMLVTVFLSVQPVAKAEAEAIASTTVKIHYLRTDGNYTNWDVWGWDKATDGAGAAYEFTGQDENGKFAVITLTPGTTQVGFIVRKNDWSAREGAANMIVDTSKGDTEVFLKSGDSNFTSQPLVYSYDKVNVNLHYYRYDEDYTGWNVWMWDKVHSAGQSYNFNKDDSYGKVTSCTFDNMKGVSEVDFIVRHSVAGNDWESKDVDANRSINLAYADSKGNIDAYLLTKIPTVYYAANQVDKSRSIDTAIMDTFKQITFTTNVKIDSASSVSLKDGNTAIAATVKLRDDGKCGVINTSAALSLDKQYTVAIEGFKGGIVEPVGVYSTKEFNDQFGYNGELGAIYSKNNTTFRVWAPTATKVDLNLYDNGEKGKGKLLSTTAMSKGNKGVWSVDKKGNLAGTFYTYSVTASGQTKETQDIYSKAVGVNGDRSMVVDLSKTNPAGWDKDKHVLVKNQTDAIIYEVDIRDISMDKNSGIKLKGKYEGFTETGTKNAEGLATGIDHLKEMGVTDVHILPFYDFATIDETKLSENNYKWGYDPKNYQSPDGSFSVDPYSGTKRIDEVKAMIQALHKAGIGVIMDSVYNHTYDWTQSAFTNTVPGYYYLHNADGTMTNGSGTGDDTDSQKEMFRKYMIDSVIFWTKEYHVDGFRFDLMGIHDIVTMNAMRKALDKIDSRILMYGEGWDMNEPIPKDQSALKANMKSMDSRIAAFSDDMRDGLKGHVFTQDAGGFVNYNGKWNGQTQESLKELVKSGIVASTQNTQVDYKKANYTGFAWAAQPTQTVNYDSCHDNNTLWDRIWISQPTASEADRIKMNEQAGFLVLTSQGIPFLHAGEEMLRSKPSASFNEADGITKDDFISNSDTSPDSVNAIDWSRKTKYNDVVKYYEGLIKLRKAHPAFRMTTTAEIQKKLKFIDTNDTTIAYTINNNANGDRWKTIAVIVNAGKTAATVTLPGKAWVVVVKDGKAGTKALGIVFGNKVTVAAGTSIVLTDMLSYIKGGSIKGVSSIDGSSLPQSNSQTSDVLGLLCGAFLVISNRSRKEVESIL